MTKPMVIYDNDLTISIQMEGHYIPGMNDRYSALPNREGVEGFKVFAVGNGKRVDITETLPELTVMAFIDNFIAEAKEDDGGTD